MMRGLKIAVCEDEPEEYEKLKRLLDESGREVEIDYFPEGSALLKSFYAGKYDLVLLDIYMKGMGGIETVAGIRQTDEEVPVAYLTGSEDFALEAYHYHVLRYLVKPPKKEEVEELLSMAEKMREHLPSLTIRTDGRERKVPLRQVRYIEQNNRNLNYYLTGGEELTSRGRLDEVEQSVPRPPFYRCHKSFLVNLAHVKDFDEDLNVFEMSEGGVVYVRRQSTREAVRAFRGFMFAQLRENP
ncbi:LytR/AlgR family response regulator transcription factor [Porcincola intestinalis]|uniref:Stage 0 sporulation protein A homolog n=1 Tax=Porcincola intestinalis TaxID=2606632 RepID=A0A6L5X8S6_9FIRM|nr:LytTR family DNA-binding domain-containing protein [Porcincola intestinalis]MCI6767966.1 LytTR family DNA-binding domain-containing protein [Lachnospiraceae bacterium]MDD7061120.1 LytTR family DNA-binding domain-containing protein [Porcincola intestinalis]MDY4205578.1 LytTR family DNA-binding domain-containing protein [Porcincola intestinalis]MDY5283472.1 LytTR family DNA-binding domain-containing protein [Porcincola intestinalis]MDY5579828.1 LytTR family DNA-binding domain-containing prote